MSYPHQNWYSICYQQTILGFESLCWVVFTFVQRPYVGIGYMNCLYIKDLTLLLATYRYVDQKRQMCRNGPLQYLTRYVSKVIKSFSNIYKKYQFRKIWFKPLYKTFCESDYFKLLEQNPMIYCVTCLL